MIDITEEKYQGSIPKECKFRTVDEHAKNIRFCWGIVLALETGMPVTCDDCEHRIKESSDE